MNGKIKIALFALMLVVNNEVVSWIILTVLALLICIPFLKEASQHD